MTAEPTRDPAPGAEMDRLIHEEVFGQVACADYYHLMLGVAGHGYVSRCAHPEGTCYPDAQPVAYSQLIEAAWLVVERAIDYQLSSCGMVDHSFPIGESEDHRHRAGLWFGKRGSRTALHGYDVAETLPLAICRAALKALQAARPPAPEEAAR